MQIAPVAFGDIPEAPGRFLLLRYGRNDYTKGQEPGAFDFTEKDADAVLADFSRRGKDIVIDYEHATLSGNPAPASGWITALEKGEDGLYAVCSWTDRGAAALSSREYRYHSPVIFFGQGRRPRQIHSVALTNHPALHSYPALVAHDNSGEHQMNEKLKKLAELLGVQAVALDDGELDAEKTADACASAIGSLKAEAETASAFLRLHDAKSFDDMTGKVKGMVPAAEKAALEQKLAAIEAEKAVAAAFDDGKLVEAQRQWALDYAAKDPQAFADFVKAAPKAPVPGPADKVPAGKPAAEAVSLSDTEKAVCRNIGIREEDYIKARKER